MQSKKLQNAFFNYLTMRLFSVIVPVYNRPDHIRSLLLCLSTQEYKHFEVLVVESGSSIKSDKVVEEFKNTLDISYILKENDGQGFSRNRGMKEAKGDYFIILDSDILLPNSYLEAVNKQLETDYLDAFGGPDKLHPDSSAFQVAVNYCMTSFLTTGGTRGSKTRIQKYYPRSFNMGVSREVYKKVGGFAIPFLGEDIEWSHRIMNAGFKVGLIQDAYVYHERKKTLKAFYQQIHFFGRARININRLVPGSFKIIHLIPFGYVGYAISLLFSKTFFLSIGFPFIFYNFLVLFTATRQTKNMGIGLYSLISMNVLMFAYAIGMMRELFIPYFSKK